MSRSLAQFLGTVPLLIALSPILSTQQDAAGYHVTKKIPVGADGGWDYAFVDTVGHRLYVSHATKAVVIDIDKDVVVGEVTPANGIHGIAIAPDLNRGFTSNGRDTSVTIFDLKTLAAVGTVKVTGANPDAIWYDALSKRVFTFNGTGENSTVIDAAKGTVVGTIPLPGKPEFAQTDGKGLLFVNIETDTGQIVVIDTRTAKETKRYTLNGCATPTGLAYDRVRNRLFSACGNRVMTVSDPAAGKVIATIPICQGTDAAAYDPGTQLAFASCSDGNVTVVKQESADKYSSMGNAPTQRGSRTMTIDPRTHKLYLASVDYAPAPQPAAPGGRAGRAATIPGSFAVLVMERKP